MRFAFIAISAHWYTHGTFIQAAEESKQVYDMYGFPEELYQVKYLVKGNTDLSSRVQELLGSKVFKLYIYSLKLRVVLSKVMGLIC